MTIRGLVKAAAAVQVTRYVLQRRHRASLSRRRKQRVLTALALGAGGGLAFWLLSQRREATPAWVEKKQRKQARRDAARKERERPVARRGEVHVEAGAETGLKVPLGEQAK